jgi:protein SCO1/2
VNTQVPHETTPPRGSSGVLAQGAPGQVPLGPVEQGEPDQTPAARRSGGRRALLLPGLVGLVILGGVTALLAGGSSKLQAPGGASASFEGGVLNPIEPAPSLSTLRDYQGQPVSLASYRGKAVFVTFLYTHCPDACPLIAADLHTALLQLGARASRVQLIAVSVDPRGDTPRAVADFLKEHGLTGQMQYLVGSGRELAPVWSAWHVGSSRDVGNPELVNHTALVYGVSAGGKLTTIYPAGFSPSQIVHDVRGLLAG